MLQQNNNNNYPCLNRAVQALQDSGKGSLPFASPLEFGDMSLIKTLRAWARSGMSAKARGSTTPLHHHLTKSCPQSSGSGQGPGVPLTPRTAATSGAVRAVGERTGLGALVTVATLKASEGGRQTQTRCLLLKAEGRNYVCAVSGANRGGQAGLVPPSRATLVGSWLRETVVGSSKEASAAKNVSQNGQCDGEVFRVKPRPAKKWRKPSNAAATFAASAEMARSGPEHSDNNGDVPKLGGTQQQQQHGAKGSCVSARLTVHRRKQTRGSAQRGGGRAKDRRGPARAVANQDSLHDTSVLAKENVDIINVPCADHSSRTVKADLKKTWSDGISGSESKGEANQDVTEPSLQISHFREPPNKEEKNINSIGEAKEDMIKSLDRTADTVCSMQGHSEITMLRDAEPAEEVLPSRWVRNLSPERRCCTELGLEEQQCCCKDVDRGVTNGKDLTEPRPIDKTEEEIGDVNRLTLSGIKPPHGHLCVERDSEQIAELDGRVENQPTSNFLGTSPQTEKEEAPQGLVKAEARSGQNPDGAHTAEDYGKAGQGSARVLRTFPPTENGGVGGSSEEQRDLGIRSTDNNLPQTALSASNTATTDGAPAVTAPAAAAAATTAGVAHACPNPAPLGVMATGLPGPRREQAEVGGGASVGAEAEPPSEGQPGETVAETHAADTVATDGEILEGGRGGGGQEGDEEEEEEDEFGGFMQAGEAPVWEDNFTEFQKVPCGRVEVSDKGNVSSWQSDWTASPSHQSDDSWAAFTQKPDGQGFGEEIASGQWWPQTAVEDKADDFNAPGVFLEAFPPVPSTTFDLNGIPTLKQLLRGAVEHKRAPEDYGETSLLDGLQDLNKMFGLKHKRTESPSWKHLLTSLQVDGHHSAHLKDMPQGHDLTAWHPVMSLQAPLVNKRRLSYDLNRNLLA